MRKLAVLGLAALLATAVAAVAYAQYAPPSHTMTASASPRTAGKSVRVSVHVGTAATGSAAAGSVTILLPSELKLSTRGFPVCPASTIARNGNLDSKCPRGSKVGVGSARLLGGSRSAGPLHYDMTVYAGSRSSLTIFLVGRGDSSSRVAFPATIGGPVSDFRQSVTVPIAAAVGRVGLEDPVLEVMDLSIGATRRARVTVRGRRTTRTYRLVTSRTCGIGRRWLLGTTVSYTRPAGTVSKQEATVGCTRPDVR